MFLKISLCQEVRSRVYDGKGGGRGGGVYFSIPTYFLQLVVVLHSF